MDFVSDFPLTQRKHDSVWVIINKLTKFAHLLLVRLDYSMDWLAEMYVDECPKTLITNSRFSEIWDQFHIYMTLF